MTNQELAEAVLLLAGRFEAIDCNCDEQGSWSIEAMYDRFNSNECNLYRTATLFTLDNVRMVVGNRVSNPNP